MALKFKTTLDAIGTTGGKVTLAQLVEPAPKPETVVFPKAWVQTPTVMTPETTALETLTAEYLELWKRYEYFEVKKLITRMDDIRKQLVGVANETVDDKKPAVFSCPQGSVEFSERGKEAVIPDPLALIHLLLGKFGATVTTSVVDIMLTPLRKILSEAELKPHVVDKPGPRKIRAVRPNP
jgi:hypothetical protein